MISIPQNNFLPQLKRLRKRLEDEDEEEHKKISDYLRFQDDVKNANIQEALKDLEEVKICSIISLLSVYECYQALRICLLQ